MHRHLNICLLALAVAALLGCAPPEHDRVDIAAALSETRDAGCFQAATPPARLAFPRDAGPHDGFRTEWWYYTGNLKTQTGRHFGYQFTLFRQALACETVPIGQSQWRTRQLYFAHFAITDTQTKTFHSAQRMNRQSIGIAGAQAHPFKIWIDDWQVRENREGKLELSAGDKDFGISLTLSQAKPMIRQGENGYSRKGPGKGNASFYFSLPRLATRGTLHTGGESFQVDGLTWFDHEWSTTALDRNVTGWDWFSAHLDDGRDIMVCQIRQSDGSPNGFGFGSISMANGEYRTLKPGDFAITPVAQWTSPQTGKTYPAGWEIRIPGRDLALSVFPVINNQEHTHMFAYWEGAARFEAATGPKGLGYVELTGY